MVYALVVALVGTLFAMLFSYYVERRRVPGRNLFDCLVTLPYMLPGTCFGIGYILAFNHPPLKLTGTVLIVMANMLFKQLPTSTKICSASLNAGTGIPGKGRPGSGGGRLAVIRDVILPGLRPAFLSCFVYNFSSSMTTAGAILFLIDPDKQLAVFKLFDAVYTGNYALASLIAAVITVIVLAVEGLVFLISWKGRHAVYLELSHLSKRFQSRQVVRDLSLSGPAGDPVHPGLLRLWQDHDPEYDRRVPHAADSGQVLLDGENITALPPERRPVTTVFQSYGRSPI